MTEAKHDYEALEAELDALITSDEPWTPEDLARQSELLDILGAAGRL